MNKEFFKTKINNLRYGVPVAIGGAIASVPGLAFAEGETSTTETAVNGMASTVVSQGTSMLNSLITTYAPLIAAVIVAGIGISMVKGFGGKARR